ncbi:DUF2523 family protein [Candidatus Methylobacter oryzae]|uniref:DUF2523 domain-containing protein n=1 Tax=Candidatus Methylobacter oryzae TaxID=2497749 RepID=A0ABY3CDT6_9GAMM|nr:DUF2523 family protein [Candidatus Methylobacter oryzae]TRW98995.1 DUF2523 domain-containing protein [Candidatus Methylobacter oryzae]
MLDLLIDAFNQISQFLTEIENYIVAFWDFVTHGIYDFAVKWLANWVIYATISTITFKLWAISFAWDIAQEILSQLNITSAIQSAWSALDSRIMDAISFFRIPEAINIILTAHVTKFVLRFLGL